MTDGIAIYKEKVYKQVKLSKARLLPDIDLLCKHLGKDTPTEVYVSGVSDPIVLNELKESIYSMTHDEIILIKRALNVEQKGIGKKQVDFVNTAINDTYKESHYDLIENGVNFFAPNLVEEFMDIVRNFGSIKKYLRQVKGEDG